MSIQRTDLPSGLTVVTEAMPGAARPASAAGCGSARRDEAAELAGASHFLEHLLFKGTEHRSGREISEAIEAVGGELNAHTAHEHTAFYTRVPERGRRRRASSCCATWSRRRRSTPTTWSPSARSSSRSSTWPRTRATTASCRWPTRRSGATTRSAARCSARSRPSTPWTATASPRFFEHHYHPANLVLVAAGAVDHDAGGGGGGAVPRPAGGRAARAARARRRDPRAATAPCCAARRSRPTCALVWPALASDDPDRYALGVCNQILGGGLSSRLFQEIREERGLAYSVFSSVGRVLRRRLAGRLRRHRRRAGRRGPQAAPGDHRRLVADGVTEREWEVALGYLEGSFLLGLEDSGSVMARLGNHVCARGEVTPVEEQLAKLRAVTPDDVAAVARRILAVQPDRLRRRPAHRRRPRRLIGARRAWPSADRAWAPRPRTAATAGRTAPGSTACAGWPSWPSWRTTWGTCAAASSASTCSWSCRAT